VLVHGTMPVQVVKGSPRVLQRALPRNLQPVEFQDLQLGRDYAEAYFQVTERPGLKYVSVITVVALIFIVLPQPLITDRSHSFYPKYMPEENRNLGTVVIFFSLTRLGNGTPFFKIVLQGSKNSSSTASTINTLVFGKLAEECSKLVHQGPHSVPQPVRILKLDPGLVEDTVVVASFGLGKSINDDDRHYCHLEVSDEAGSTIYPVAPKYTYTPLNNLKSETVVNLYGAVKFFKPPHGCKGTDYCSVVTIVDQSNTNLTCTLFNTNKDALPQIYRNGDIVRFHRIKVREYNGQMQGISSIGFAALTFDGTIGTPVVPRTSSKMFTFTDEDRKTVEDMRIWVASNFPSFVPTAKLSDIQPPMYFEFTCQLVGKAKVDGSSYLLKVWDGTKCPFPSWKVFVKEDDVEGDGSLIHQLRNLTVDIVVYDNHVRLAKFLKVGSIIKMYNLHAKTHIPEDKPEVSYIQFHLHGGTEYGRGITVLAERSTDAKELKAFLDSVDLTESEHSERPASPDLETTYLPLGSCLDRCQQLSVTDDPVKSCAPFWLKYWLDVGHYHFFSKVTNLHCYEVEHLHRSPQQYRVRAKLRRFEPVKLHQSVKLHCPLCNSLQEVPDGPELDLIIQEASASHSNPELQSPSFCESVLWDTENRRQCHVAVHFVKHAELLQDPEDSLILLEALGVVPLQYVFLMKFKLDDGTGSLDVYLLDCVRDYATLEIFTLNINQKFFQIPASEVLINNIFQENMERIMEKLCPAGKNLDELPWLECFIKSYYIRNETGEQLCYRIFDTMIAEDV
ncbi:hypothetical protein JD844_027746, partial [Phrynosoma platyrhinos]